MMHPEGRREGDQWVPAHHPTLTSKPDGHSTRSLYVVDAVDAMYNTYICSCYIHVIYNLMRCYVHAMYIYTYVSGVCVSVICTCMDGWMLSVAAWAVVHCDEELAAVCCGALRCRLGCGALRARLRLSSRHSMIAFHHLYQHIFERWDCRTVW